MIEILDTFRGGEEAEIETRKASRGIGLRGLRERRKSQSVVTRKLLQRDPAKHRPKMDLVHFELNRMHPLGRL